MHRLSWTIEHIAENGDLRAWCRLYKQIFFVSNDNIMTLEPGTVKILRHWERVRRNEADNPPAPAPKRTVSEISCEGPWNFVVPKKSRRSLDEDDIKGIYKRQRCAYFEAHGCQKGDQCDYYHNGWDDEVRNPKCPKALIGTSKEWVVSEQSGRLIKYNKNTASLGKAEWRMVLQCAEQHNNEQIWHSTQMPPGDSHPLMPQGLNEFPQHGKRMQNEWPSAPSVDRPPQDHWPPGSNHTWGKKDWNEWEAPKGDNSSNEAASSS